jgi:hypothetical protein
MINEEVEQELEENSLSEDLAAAWDEDPETDEIPVEETTTSADPEPEAEPAGAELAVVDDPAPEAVAEPVAEGAAPQSLSATAREAWKDTPKAMQDEIAKREHDFATGIQKYAEQAKRADGMDRSLQPYQQYLSMNGGAGKALEGLLQTGSGLQMGSPIQKAQIIGNLIQQFGVDIQTLDGLLSGNGAPPEVAQHSAVQAQIDAAVAPYQQHMAQQQQRQQYENQQAGNAINGEITTFSAAPENEFYHDVKMQMADILDLASNRGQQMGLKEAYAMACQLNPEIKKIVDGRAIAASSGSRRRAASSIHGNPGGPGGVGAPGTMRSAIEDAWENSGRD